MADPPTHITFVEPEGEGPLIEAVAAVIDEWFGPNAESAEDPSDPQNLVDCAGNIVGMLQGWSSEPDDWITPCIGRPLR